MSFIAYIYLLGFAVSPSARNCEKVDIRVKTVVAYIAHYSYVNNLPFQVTSCWRSYSDGFSETDTHQTYRAMDLSVRNWSMRHKRIIMNKVTELFNSYGAYSYSDGKQRVIIIHDIGRGEHFHIQTKRSTP